MLWIMTCLFKEEHLKVKLSGHPMFVRKRTFPFAIPQPVILGLADFLGVVSKNSTTDSLTSFVWRLTSKFSIQSANPG